MSLLTSDLGNTAGGAVLELKGTDVMVFTPLRLTVDGGHAGYGRSVVPMSTEQL